jgi:beta-galactosidase
MSEMKHDMENLKRHGFNLIKLQENWAIDEPQEGRYDFSRYEELIDHAAALDLGIYLGLTCEQAPGWLWRKHPSCRMVGRDGLPLAYEAQTTLPADGKPGPCYDDDGARADMERFITELVRCLGRFENIVVWNTWQEIAYWPLSLVGQDVCYCDNTQRAFRTWLKEKYGDLDALNRAWNARYLDWDSVVPDRLPNLRHPQPNNIEWHYFMTNVQIANVLRSRAQAIRAADPLKRPVFAHKGGPVIGSGEDWTYARCQDFMGSSCYPAWHPFQAWDDGAPAPGARFDPHSALLAEMWDGVALKYDYIRSANPRGNPVWAAEFQGGPVSTHFHKGRVPAAEDMRRWMLSAIGSGVTAISFWVTRAEIHAAEMNGFSLLDSEGETTPRYEEAARIGQALNHHADLFAQPTRPGADVAILIDEHNYQFCNTLAYGHSHQPFSVRGWYRLLWDLGISVDFIEASELDEPYVQAYKAIILPFPLSIAERVARQLETYVNNGGNLISEAAPGRINECGYANRGELSPTLRALFGVRQTSLSMIREPGDPQRWMPQERTWGEFLEPAMLIGAGPLQGHMLRANLYLETFECQGSAPLLYHDAAVAGTVRSAGAGKAWLLGTYVGHSGVAYRDSANHEAVEALMALCGVTPERAGDLLIRKRVAAGKEAWLFTNPTQYRATAEIAIPAGARVSDLLGEPLTIEGGKVLIAVPSLDIRVLLLEQ